MNSAIIGLCLVFRRYGNFINGFLVFVVFMLPQISAAQTMTTGPENYEISALSSEEGNWLDGQRQLVFDHFSDADRITLTTTQDKLSAINAILNSGIYGADDVVVLEALGVVFGDILAEVAGLGWVSYSDEYGS